MSAPTYDVAVVGAGLIGLATAYRLLEQRPRLRVVVLDKENGVGRHQSSHNSGVLHAGVYYPPGSLKAKLCRAGKSALEAFATEHGIPFIRCGKLIVALDPSQLDRLRALHDRASANGVPGVSLIGRDEMADIEPHAAGIAALRVPDAGIIDFAAVTEAYAAEVTGRGGEVRLGQTVTHVADAGTRVGVVTERDEFSAVVVATCAGLQADRFGGRQGPRIVPFRGDYYTLTPDARHLVRGLIYPVPDPALPFLGVHFTRRVDGSVWAGPNAVLALAREGYRRRSFRPDQVTETITYQGFRRLARRYWRTGAVELWRDVSRRAFLRQLRRYVPELEAAHLVSGPSGVRAQAVASDGTLVDDFCLIETNRAVHVRNAPSPGATASLAIGQHIAELVLRKLGDESLGPTNSVKPGDEHF
jgi:L-2-hydroxyglutarate oxidase LhgO